MQILCCDPLAAQAGTRSWDGPCQDGFQPKMCSRFCGEVAQLANDLLASSLHGPPDTTSYRVWKLFDQVCVVVLHVKKGFSLTFLTVLQAA